MKKIIKPLSIKQQVNRINKYMNYATSGEFKTGLNWYNDARELCQQLATKYNTSLIQVAQVISVLSPQKKWATNKLEVISLYAELFDDIKPPFNYFATKKQIDECKDIMNGLFLIPAKRVKTFSFADNIANKKSIEITIDRHALRIAYDDQTANIDKVSPKQYREAKEAYKIVADQHGLEGFEVGVKTRL